MCNNRLKRYGHIAITPATVAKIVATRDEKLEFEQSGRNAFKG
jgi:hypothetical protein